MKNFFPRPTKKENSMTIEEFKYQLALGTLDITKLSNEKIECLHRIPFKHIAMTHLLQEKIASEYAKRKLTRNYYKRWRQLFNITASL